MARELKTQFINYMTVQRFSAHTKRSYLTGVKLLAKHYMQSPDTLTNDQIQDYIRHLLEERKLSWGTCNAYLSGIVGFYRHICKWDDTQFVIRPSHAYENLQRWVWFFNLILPANMGKNRRSFGLSDLIQKEDRH